MSDHLSVFGSLPDTSLFVFPPGPHPAPLPPAPQPASIMHPFNIPDRVFAAALDPRVPLVIAALYAVTVKALTRYNLSHGRRPWNVSKTRAFDWFVVLHNILLAVYSAWSFWGMLGGMRRSIQHPFGPGGLAATADSFCRVQGPPGLGRSVYFDDAAGRWDSAVAGALMVDGVPSPTQGGRLWNEGLAYYGWIFYLSKFYEVLDTVIILAKGKPSSTLQTYHHAGAMMCMWAGMRYMSVPIWVFVLVNSFVHAVMYTYYTLTAFKVRVPMVIKRSLTTMQITQFVLGASYAAVHSFVSFVVPITIPLNPAEAPAGGNAAGVLEPLKRLVFGQGAAPAATAPDATATAYITQPCIATAGETFALCLNVLYLAPLTYLFASFFVASYVKRSNAAVKIPGKASRRLSNVTLAEKAGWDAAKGVEREVYGGESMANGNESAVVEEDAPAPAPKTNGRVLRRR